MEDQELASNENLDRASPELWPDQSVSEFISTRQPDLNIQTPSKYRTDLDKEDLELIHDFGSLSTQQLMDKIKHLQNLAYQVGLEECTYTVAQRNGSWKILEYIGETLSRIGTISYALYTIQLLNTHFDCTDLPPLWPSSFRLVPD
uniref:Uncharacterized protein n=1 Tax=Echinococcus canadensis TaxID=519352 RepID=A0A915F0D9_9CEST